MICKYSKKEKKKELHLKPKCGKERKETTQHDGINLWPWLYYCNLHLWAVTVDGMLNEGGGGVGRWVELPLLQDGQNV